VQTNRVGKTIGKKSDVQVELKRLEFSFTTSEFVFCPPLAFYEQRVETPLMDSLTRAPSVPPPKNSSVNPTVFASAVITPFLLYSRIQLREAHWRFLKSGV
jgi:hypothetical protein